MANDRLSVSCSIGTTLFGLLLFIDQFISSLITSFQASNDRERNEWIEKVQEAILNALNLAPEKKEGKKGVRAAVSNTTPANDMKTMYEINTISL